MIFTQEEKIFIVESYFRNGHLVDGVWQYSIQAGFVEFSQQFADACIELFHKTGLVDRKKSSGHPKKSTDQVIENMRQIIEEVPRTSLRRLSQQVKLSPATYRTILKKDIHFYPYRVQAVQQLCKANYSIRVEYCRSTIPPKVRSVGDYFKAQGYRQFFEELHDDEIIDGYFNKTVPLHTLYMNLNLNKSFWMNQSFKIL
ncbi:HTH Tnp Tc3 2 domain containing protein [Asbolus verrucosus]|uniref:HTH Tnp Tc3 2 domain containing protein n=1 Tax=Asbolus verrucosus TaxID=1661398 RepID=A0A482VMH0_ASBVE|nr:HTH Tnp Tc3 2 domain containing protein [Asbolus verrucosus]